MWEPIYLSMWEPCYLAFLPVIANVVVEELVDVILSVLFRTHTLENLSSKALVDDDNDDDGDDDDHDDGVMAIGLHEELLLNVVVGTW